MLVVLALGLEIQSQHLLVAWLVVQVVVEVQVGDVDERFKFHRIVSNACHSSLPINTCQDQDMLLRPRADAVGNFVEEFLSSRGDGASVVELC